MTCVIDPSDMYQESRIVMHIAGSLCEDAPALVSIKRQRYNPFCSERSEAHEVIGMATARDEISALFHQIHREIRDRMRQSFRDCQLPFGALHLLKELRGEPGVTVTSWLAERGWRKATSPRCWTT